MNYSKNRLAAIACITSICAANADAATLRLEPATLTIASGTTFSIDVVITGLGDAAAPSLGDFDIDIGFDPVALDLVGFELGAELGDVGIAEAIDVSFGELVAGIINVAEVSFLPDSELNDLQPDAFVLVTLNFLATGLGAGKSAPIDIPSVLSLGNALGEPIAVDSVSATVVTVAADSDGDGVNDTLDNCTLLFNPSQCDSDSDGFGNHCDGDLNNTGGIVNFEDLSVFAAAFGEPSAKPDFSAADFDCSGNVVGFGDLSSFASLFGSPPGPAAGD